MARERDPPLLPSPLKERGLHTPPLNYEQNSHPSILTGSLCAFRHQNATCLIIRLVRRGLANTLTHQSKILLITQLFALYFTQKQFTNGSPCSVLSALQPEHQILEDWTSAIGLYGGGGGRSVYSHISVFCNQVFLQPY